MLSLENVDVLKTKDLRDVSLAQILFDAVSASATGKVTLELDGEGTGFVVHIPHEESMGDVH